MKSEYGCGYYTQQMVVTVYARNKNDAMEQFDRIASNIETIPEYCAGGFTDGLDYEPDESEEQT